MDLLKKSVSVITSLQLKNGGLLATPKNGAYPYIYPRDAVIMTKALNRVGKIKNSERFYYFIKNKTKIENYKEIMHRYNPNGLPAVTRKHQHDNSPLIIHGIYDTFLHNKKKRFLVEMWSVVQICAKNILESKRKSLIITQSSIHENDTLEKGREIWVNCAACRALLDASKIASRLGCRKEEKIWKKESEKLKIKITKNFFDKKRKIYKKSLKHPNASDLSQLSPFYFEIDESKKNLESTLDYLKKNLWDETLGGFRRFKKFEIVKDWHWYTRGSGTWTVLTLWAAKFYKSLKNKKSHDECVKFIEKISSRTKGLLPEHVATKTEYDSWKNNELEFNSRITNEMRKAELLNSKIKEKYKEDLIYWALPLGWSHAEYILLKK